MAQQIPTTLRNVHERVNGSSKQMFNNAKEPFQKFLQDKIGTKRSATQNLDGTSTRPYELDELQNSNANMNQNNPSLQVHSNFVLKAAENFSCCNCQKRWQMAILAHVGFLIVFGIRCNFGAAKNHMSRDFVDPWGHKHKREFNWTTAELGVMESSFFYGYLITQVPAGFFAAKFPANKMFGIAIGGASFLNILLPFAFNARSNAAVALIQILQGLVQGLGYPSMHGVWRHWAPPFERSKLATTAFAGSYAGAVFGMPLSAWLVSYVSWSAPFYLYGIAGVFWSIFWFSMTFEKPAFHPTISKEEKEFIEEKIGHVSQSQPTFSSIPWKAILTSKPVYAIIVANFARSWNFYLLLQNQLTYMRDVLGLRINDSGLIAAIPHAVMGVVVLLGGRLADYLRSNKILSTTAVRKIFNCGGFGFEALFLLIVAYSKSERTAVLAMIIAVGCSGFAISGFNVNHLDIAPRYAAILMGFSNGIGTLAGLTCPFVVEMLTAPDGNHATHRNGWVTVFLLAALIHFTGITFYAVYASGELQDWAEPKEEEEPWKNVAPIESNTKNNSNNPFGAINVPIPVNYGAAETSLTRLDPIPDVTQLQQQKTNNQAFYNSAWDTAPNYQAQPFPEQSGFDAGYGQQMNYGNPNQQQNQYNQSNSTFTSARNNGYQPY